MTGSYKVFNLVFTMKSATYINILLISVIFVLLFNFCLNQDVVTNNNKNSVQCGAKESCGACIREVGCVWCNDPFVASLNNKLQRCVTLEESKIPNWCSKKNIINPVSKFQIIKNNSLQISTEKGAVQITPQKVKITLRKGEEIKLNFKYAQAEDYPVDLYYIMDLSASMKKHKTKLSILGTKLANTMKNITKNFRLGFGSFVDKVAMPYVSTVPEKLEAPCKIDGVNCAPPYSFKNHLSLTDKTETFSEQVLKARVSGNLDSPEGGLDALMQAMVCQKEIGWRPKARHLLVFSTDAGYHIAGDGKLAGIVEPNDGECHMKNGEYTDSLIYDYPSIGQINRKAIENNINIIFAVVKDQEKTYLPLKDRIEGSANGTLSEDSSNVVDIVKNVYNDLVDSVVISDDSPNNIEVKYYSACRGSIIEETKECGDIRVGVQVEFTAIIKALDCFEDNNTKVRTFHIKPGTLNESLMVEVEILCDCQCETEGNFKRNAVECNRVGDLKCGICDCYPGKFGSNCDCDVQNSTIIEDSSSCKMTNTSEICSGLGTCKCNICDCNKRNNENERIYGSFCECNNYSCKRSNLLLCSGPTRGKCDCGKCICYSGWSGDACECPDNNSTCISPQSKQVCSGQGECKCGQCECSVIDGYRYSGEFCDECPSCPGQRCEEYRHCVECLAYGTGIYDKEECQIHCTKFTVEYEEIIEENIDESSENGDNVDKICRYPDNTGCTFIFKYSYNSSNLNIFAQRKKICAASVDVLAVVLGVIFSILIGGMVILLIWKGYTTFHDKREYAKFENERRNAKWNRGENPLFKNPTSTFHNPTFSSEN